MKLYQLKLQQFPEIAAALDAFYAQHSEHTRIAYQHSVDSLQQIRDPWHTADHIDIMKWLTALRAAGLSDATVKLRFDSIRSLFGLLVDLELLQTNPCRKVRRLFSLRQRRQVRPTKLINFKQIKHILKSSLNGLNGARDAAILAVLFGCGLRRSEAIALNVGDVAVSSDCMPYLELRRTKAGVPQQVPIPHWAWKYIKPLTAGREPDEPLFLSRQYGGKKNRIAESTFFRLYRRLVGAAPHSARATFASRLRAQGCDERDVAEALRHSTISMVRTYDKRVRGLSESPALKIQY